MPFPRIFLGTLREHYLLLFGAASGIALVAGFVGAWVGAHFGARAATRHAPAETNTDLASARQMRELAESIDAVMLEVERVAEAQRFVAKVLAERPAPIAAMPPVARREPGQITPH